MTFIVATTSHSGKHRANSLMSTGELKSSLGVLCGDSGKNRALLVKPILFLELELELLAPS